MKSLYQRVGSVLILSFVIQVICVSLFFKWVDIRNIVDQVNLQESNRQSILQEAANSVVKDWNSPNKIQSQLNYFSKRYGVSFTVKNTNGETVYFSHISNSSSNFLEEQSYIRMENKNAFIIYGSFPPNINKLKPAPEQQYFRVFIVAIVVIVSVATSFIIYSILADPLKKLAKAVENINYGSTLVKIPYYHNDEIGVLCRNFEEMGQRLRKSEENQKELIQAISHDIKTPLTSIMGYSKRLIEGKAKGERLPEYYEIIHRKSVDLKNLLQEIDDYSILNASAKYEKEPVSAVKYVSELKEELIYEVEQYDCIFKIDSSIEDDVMISVDEKKLKRVFLNIIHNSIKYAGENCSINLHCYISGLRGDRKLYFDLSDNGSGVPEDQLERIFDRFYRIESSRSREKGGTGLGLAICKDIIRNHGGEIGAENKAEGGFKIWFYLPEI